MVACGQPHTADSGERTTLSAGRIARFRRLRRWLAIIALGYTALTLVMRSLPLINNVALLIAVSTPYAVLLAVMTFLSAILKRLAMVAVVVMVASLGTQLHWYYGNQTRSSAEGVEIRILSANLRKGRADVQSMVEMTRSSADLMTLSVLTPA